MSNSAALIIARSDTDVLKKEVIIGKSFKAASSDPTWHSRLFSAAGCVATQEARCCILHLAPYAQCCS